MKELRQKMVKEMVLRNFSPRTQESYQKSVYALSKHYMRSPDCITDEEIKNYIYHLSHEKKLAWNSRNVAIHGIRFFL